MTSFAPILLGLAGSLHCVGMCGPLMLACSPDAATRWLMLRQTLLYHTGRILTYSLLGLLFGLLGQGLLLAGLQKAMALLAGGGMLGMALFSWRTGGLSDTIPGIPLLSGWLRDTMGALLRQNTPYATVTLGFLNGFLPCGMVYAALAGAISSATPIEGSFFMAAFGMGTLPLLLATLFLSRSLSPTIRHRLRKAQPILLVIVGLALIHRGLHLDLSTIESAVPKAELICH
jgi:uncharacterized protein